MTQRGLRNWKQGAVGFFLISFFVFFNHHFAEAVEFKLEGENQPGEVVDGVKQRSFEVKGFADQTGSGYYNDLKIHARWKNSGIIDVSPNLGGGPFFGHSFPIGDTQRCGLVSFKASAKRRTVKYESKDKYVYVDCQAPRVVIGKPTEGQMVRAGSFVDLELRLEDDLLVQTGYSEGLKGYVLEIDVNGEKADVRDFFSNSPVLHKQKVYISNSEGRHGIRVRFSDRTGKTAEKTIWLNADATAPQIRVISPLMNEVVTLAGGGIPALTVKVESTDPGSISSGVDKVEFYLDGVGVAVAQKPSEPNIYTGTFGISQPGEKTITVKAHDKVGNVAQAEVKADIRLSGATVPTGPVPKPSRTLPGKR